MEKARGVTTRRRSERLQIEVPIIFAWFTRGRKKQRTIAATRNVGTHGIFVCADGVPPENTRITLELRLPPASSQKTELRLTGVGQVIRTESMTGGKTGFVLYSEKKFSIKKAAENFSSELIAVRQQKAADAAGVARKTEAAADKERITPYRFR